MVLDLIVALVVSYAFYTGYSRGLIKTVFDTMSLIIGLVASMKLSPRLIDILEQNFSMNGTLAFILGFVLTFIFTIFIIRFVGKKIEDIFEFANINFINKIFGGLLMLFVFSTVIAYIIWFLNKGNLITDEQLQTSLAHDYLKPLPDLTRQLFGSLQPLFQEFWDKLLDTFDRLKETGESK